VSSRGCCNQSGSSSSSACWIGISSIFFSISERFYSIIWSILGVPKSGSIVLWSFSSWCISLNSYSDSNLKRLSYSWWSFSFSSSSSSSSFTFISFFSKASIYTYFLSSLSIYLSSCFSSSLLITKPSSTTHYSVFSSLTSSYSTFISWASITSLTSTSSF
jgi:hypothetical protein